MDACVNNQCRDCESLEVCRMSRVNLNLPTFVFCRWCCRWEFQHRSHNPGTRTSVVGIHLTLCPIAYMTMHAHVSPPSRERVKSVHASSPSCEHVESACASIVEKSCERVESVHASPPSLHRFHLSGRTCGRFFDVVL